MSARRISRILCLAMFVIAAAQNAGAKNLAEMAATLLRDVVTGYSPSHTDDGKFHIVVLYNDYLLDDSMLRDNDVVAQKKKIALVDVYTQLRNIDAAEGRRLQCVIVVDLTPQQVIAAEQFARERNLVIASVILTLFPDIDRGSVPFIFDVPQQVAMMRSLAVSSYGLRLKSFSPKGVPELARETRFRNVDRCAPLVRDDEGAYPYVVCHDNAFARMDDKKSWQEGVRDLDTALLGHYDDQLDVKVYPRGWGLKGYHPHIGLADYLSRYGNCPGAQRELKIALMPKDAKKKAELEQRIHAQCTAVAAMADERLSWSILARDDTGAAESEHLPPFSPPLIWSEIAAIR
jgi:hypothetical protein